MLSVLESQVATLFADAVLYGLYLATLLHCLRRLLYEQDELKPSHRIDWFMLIMTIAIFLSTTLDTVLSVRRTMLYIRQVMTGTQPILLWSDTTMTILVHLQTLFADAVLTYRCWIVFARSRLVIVFPIALWLVDFICMIIRAHWQLKQAIHIKLVIIIFWACSIALNLYATSMIAYRLTKFKSQPTRRIRFVMRVIIESGLMYTATAVMLFISVFTNNAFAATFLSAINFEVVGIAFNLIIIRVASGAVDEETQVTQGPLTTIHLTTIDSSDRRDKGNSSDGRNVV